VASSGWCVVEATSSLVSSLSGAAPLPVVIAERDRYCVVESSHADKVQVGSRGLVVSGTFSLDFASRIFRQPPHRETCVRRL
jgi:hypothetical protein